MSGLLEALVEAPAYQGPGSHLRTRNIQLPRPQSVGARTTFAGRALFVLVCSLSSIDDFRDQDSYWDRAVLFDIRGFINEHLMEAAQVQTSHDGRNPKVLWHLANSPAMQAIV